MKSRDFCYWLQGFFEVNEAGNPERCLSEVTLNAKQVKCIKNHLNLVFKHDIDPEAGGPEVQASLNSLHGNGDPRVRC